MIIYGHTAPPEQTEYFIRVVKDKRGSEGQTGSWVPHRVVWLPFPFLSSLSTLGQQQKTHLFLGNWQFFKISSLHFAETKRHVNDQTVEWPMVFIWERGLALWVWGAQSESNPYFICIHLWSSKSYQLSIINTRLSTVGWQEAGPINSWMITVSETLYW